MGTTIATLPIAVPNTTWVNATSLCAVSKRLAIESPAAGRCVPFLNAARGEFPAPRGVLILT